MTLRLTVDHEAWDAHVRAVVSSVDGLLPVVKGNGYGFGRPALAAIAAAFAPGGEIAVGAVYEAGDVPSSSTPVVLAPHIGPLPESLPPSSILCVGSDQHIGSLSDAGWRGRVHVKVRSSMQRYGIPAADVGRAVASARAHGMDVAGFTIHLPLSGSDDDRLVEVAALLDACDPALPVSVSHLAPDSFARLQAQHRDRVLRLRLGTALWHGDKSALRLCADVVDVHPVHDGEVAGYRRSLVTTDGSLVVVGAGSAHGVASLPDGRSPLHFARERMPLLEQPHMHTTMALVPSGRPCPGVGDWVDVQRPLTMVMVDEVVRRR